MVMMNYRFWTRWRRGPLDDPYWHVLVDGEVVDVSKLTTIRQIRDRLPARLQAEFTRDLEVIRGYAIHAVIRDWGLPLDKLLVHRRQRAEVYYRGACVDWENVVVPADIDVDEIMMTYGDCLLGTSPEFLPRDETSPSPMSDGDE